MSDLAKGRRTSTGRHRHCVLRSATYLLLATLAVCGSAALAQGGRPGPGGPGGPGRGPGFPGDRGAGDRGPGGGSDRTTTSAGHNSLQRGPAGRWWDNSGYAQRVGLTGDQQRRMDGVFAENRSALVNNLDNLRKAEARLSALSASDHPSESALNTEIQNVAQARADLEKANTHMLLQIRNEMTQVQINKLEKLQ